MTFLNTLVSKAAVVALSLSISSLSAAAAADDEAEFVAEAQAKLKATFQNLNVTDFREGPIPGLFEMNVGGQIVYFHPEEEVLIFGEIFSKEGLSLTAQSRSRTDSELHSGIPTEQAIVIGPEDGVPIIEFTNPNCGYCRQLDQYLAGVGQPVKRIIFFAVPQDPSAIARAVHVACSDDKEAAFREIYSGAKNDDFTACEEGQALVNSHRAISSKAGVQATPTLYLGRTPVRGFRRDAIGQYITEQLRLLASN